MLKDNIEIDMKTLETETRAAVLENALETSVILFLPLLYDLVDYSQKIKDLLNFVIT